MIVYSTENAQNVHNNYTMNGFYRSSAVIKSSSESELLILVDEHDREIGTKEKLDAHRDANLHRAFSIFVFDDAQRLLLQKRAIGKYHSGGLWSNTCCGHPRPGEETLAAAERRLDEEMNFRCSLKKFFTFRYRVELENNLVENEIDHVIIGKFNGTPRPDESEAQDWKWVDLDELRSDVSRQPEVYSFWLKTALQKSEWQLLRAYLDLT